MLVVCVQWGYAQTQSIKGVVTEAETGEPLPGVAVIEKGTNNGTSTDIEGNFELSLTTDNPVLVVSAIGREEQEVPVGNEEFISISLKSASEALNEIVVTALGISREKRSLGYATEEVDGESITKVKDANFMNSLSGKVAGLNVKSSGTMGGSANVIIRGYKSLTGNNQALFVVDGIPISNEITNNTNQQTGRGGFDYGNAAMDINPEDIESVNVLKGAAATALYGTRAANGAIIITTKSGSGMRGKKGIGVSINSRVSFGNIDKTTMPTYQQEYGPGYGDYYNGDGYYVNANGDSVYTGYRVELVDIDGDGVKDVAAPMGEDASYGAPFSMFDEVYTWESIYPELSTYGKPQPFTAAANDPTEFYETSVTTSNNVALTGANEQGNFRLSFTQFDQKGILPNSRLERYNASFSGGYNFTDRLKVSTKASFINNQGLGRFGTGYDNRNPNQSFRQWFNVGADIKRLEEAYDLTGKNLTWNPVGYTFPPEERTQPHFFDNPYFVRYENYETDNRNRFIGNFVVDYKLADWVTAVGRVSLDSYSEIQEERIAVGSIDIPEYRRRNYDFKETNYQARLDFMKYFGSDNEWNINGNLGTNIRRTEINSWFAKTNGGLVVPGVYSLNNSINPISFAREPGDPRPEEDQVIGVNSLFARASVGYGDFIYVDLTARNDWYSTLPSDNNSYPYPSATLSFIFSEFIDSDVLNFGKFRINWADVGNDAPFGSLKTQYDINPSFNGIALASAPNTANNSELKPENTKSVEVGVETKFFNNRLGLDVSLYNSNSYNQIFTSRLSTASGTFFRLVNAGELNNKGIEVSLYANPVKTDNFSWDLNVNWALNRNEVKSLFGDNTELLLASPQGGINITAAVGEPFGTIKGSNFVYTKYDKYDDQGNPAPGAKPTDDAQIVVYDMPSTAPGGGVRYRRTSTPEVLGNIQPDWTGGVSNTLSYKNFSLYFLVDFQKGGDFFSLDTWYGYATGLYDVTAGTNDKGNPVRSSVEDGGGIKLEDPKGNGLAYEVVDPNTGEVSYKDNELYGNMYYFGNAIGYGRAPNALHVYDASFIKLREAALSYRFPKSMTQNWFVNNLELSVYGRNLWIIHKNAPYTDPEAGLSAGRIQGYQSGAYPMVREVGFKVGLDF